MHSAAHFVEQGMGTVCRSSTLAAKPLGLGDGHQKVGGGEEVVGVGSVAMHQRVVYYVTSWMVILLHSEVSLAGMDFGRSEFGVYSMVGGFFYRVAIALSTRGASADTISGV